MSGVPTRLFHYTSEDGLQGILESQSLLPSLVALNPADARYGDGQYLSDFAPGTKSLAELSRAFLGFPFQGRRFTHYVEIDVTGLGFVAGREGVYVVLNTEALDLTGRILGFSFVPLP